MPPNASILAAHWMNNTKDTPKIVERALLVGAYHDAAEKHETQSLLEELEELVHTLGIPVIDRMLVFHREQHAKYLIGSGKAEEIAALVKEHALDVVVFDNELSPSQQRNWEALTGVAVIDRQEVILDIFGKRAKTREARLQVELAKLQYSMPRLTRAWGHLVRQGGGIGAKGEGESQLEQDKRRIRGAIDRCKRELITVKEARATQRKDRKRTPVPNCAIVGYTNSGKSSLLRRLTGALEHPGVIPVHALGVDANGGPLLVMKRVEGVDWATLLGNAEHPLWSILTANADRLAANLGILMNVCRTIEFAHSRGILHRDIKPENVMVGSYGEVYLVDWGIATPLAGPTTTEGIAGTPAYMAPEMFFGMALDERTDVYLLGATLHEVLTGRSRHDGKDIVQVLQSVSASTPVAYDASVPEQLGALCNAATARDRAARPKDAAAFRDQIAEFLQTRSALALSDAASERLVVLDRMLEGAPNAVPADLSTAYRLATEARFGFVQSLREHPNDGVATAGLRASIMALVELEIRQKHADTAEALLREVAAPDPSLFTRLAAVRAEDEIRKREVQRLEAIDHDLDPMVEAAPRAMLVALLVVLVFTITAVAVTSGGITPLKVVLFGAVFTAALLIGTTLFRKRLTSNAFNRKLAGLMVFTSVLIEVERVIGYFSGISTAQMFRTDLWLAAAGVGAAAITLRSRLWGAVVSSVVGGLLATRFPESAAPIFSVAMGVTFVLMGIALWPTTSKDSRR